MLIHPCLLDLGETQYSSLCPCSHPECMGTALAGSPDRTAVNLACPLPQAILLQGGSPRESFSLMRSEGSLDRGQSQCTCLDSACNTRKLGKRGWLTCMGSPAAFPMPSTTPRCTASCTIMKPASHPHPSIDFGDPAAAPIVTKNRSMRAPPRFSAPA